jgi:hypothetical protein
MVCLVLSHLEQSFFADSIVGSFDIEANQAHDPSATPGRVDSLLQEQECLFR